MSPRSSFDRRAVLSGTAAIVLAGGLGGNRVFAQDASPESASPQASSEEQAVGEVLFTMAIGFATRDADIAASVYTDDVEWINAFGDWIVGRQDVHAKLSELFASDEFQAGEIVSEPSGSVRILTDTTAVGWTYQEIEGQEVAEGEIIDLRKNHSLAVLVKTGDEWLITAHIFMDENIV